MMSAAAFLPHVYDLVHMIRQGAYLFPWNRCSCIFFCYGRPRRVCWATSILPIGVREGLGCVDKSLGEAAQHEMLIGSLVFWDGVEELLFSGHLDGAVIGPAVYLGVAVGIGQ